MHTPSVGVDEYVDPKLRGQNGSLNGASRGGCDSPLRKRVENGCRMCKKIHMNQKIRDILLLKRRVGKWRNSP